MTFLDIYQAGEFKPSDAINIVMGAASFTGVGAIVAGGYFVVDTSFWLLTGTSLNDRIDNATGGWSVKIK